MSLSIWVVGSSQSVKSSCTDLTKNSSTGRWNLGPKGKLWVPFVAKTCDPNLLKDWIRYSSVHIYMYHKEGRKRINLTSAFLATIAINLRLLWAGGGVEERERGRTVYIAIAHSNMVLATRRVIQSKPFQKVPLSSPLKQEIELSSIVCPQLFFFHFFFWPIYFTCSPKGHLELG